MSPGIPLFAPAPAQPAAGFGVRDLLRLVFKYRLTLAVCLLVVSAVTIFAALRQPREFVASAQLRIRTEQQGTPSFLSGVAAYRETTVQDTPNRRIETEMADLMNRSSVESVIRELSLRPQDLKRSALDIVLEPLEPVGRALDGLARRLGLGGEALPPDPLADAVKAFERSVAIDALRSKGAEVTSNVIEVKLTGTDRLRTQQALARLLEQYVQRSSSRDLELGREAFKALSQQADEARAKMNKAEDAIVAYALRRPIPAEGATASVAGRATPVAESKMRTDEETLQARLDVLRQTYGEQYLEVKTTRIALERLRARMKTQARDNVRSDANLGVLERRRAVAEARYVELQRKLDQIDLFLKLGPTEAQAALITEPPRPAVKASIAAKLIGLVAGPVIGLLLGVVLAGVFEAADRRLQTREAVQSSLGLTTLAAIPQLKVPSRGDASDRPAPPPFDLLPPPGAHERAALASKGVAA